MKPRNDIIFYINTKKHIYPSPEDVRTYWLKPITGFEKEMNKSTRTSTHVCSNLKRKLYNAGEKTHLQTTANHAINGIVAATTNSHNLNLSGLHRGK